MSCATGFVKVIMFIFNFIISLAGLGLIGAGTLYYLKIDDYDKVVDEVFAIAPTLALIVGVVVFVIAFFGCCGAIRESHCMLVTYAVLLLTLFALQLALGIYTYLQVKDEKGDIQPVIKTNMDKLFKEYNDKREARELFDFFQKELHCCGVDGPTDYTTKFMNGSLPASCCTTYDGKPCYIMSPASLSGLLSGTFNYYLSGCASTLSKLIVNGMQALSYVAFGISAIEIIGAVFALCLASSIKNESRRRYS